MNIRIYTLVCLFACALFPGMDTDAASSFDGGGTSGYLEDSINVQNCGFEKRSGDISFFHMDPKGKWTIVIDSRSYRGTYSELKKERRYSLILDPSSYTDLLIKLETDVDALCGLPAGSTSIINSEVEFFAATLNKKGTRLHIALMVNGVHSDGTVTSSILYRLKGSMEFDHSGCSRKYRSGKKSSNTLKGYPQAVAASDINGDGAVDIAISSGRILIKATGVKADSGNYKPKIVRKDSSKVVVYLHDTFSQDAHLKQNVYTISKKQKRKRLYGPQAHALAIDDINSDGLKDIAAIDRRDSMVRVFLQDMAIPGQFLPRSNHKAGDRPVDIAIGDLDEDGIKDIAVAGDDLVLLMNDHVEPGSAFNQSALGISDVTSVVISDLNGDGRNDLTAVSDDSIVVLLQDLQPAAPGNFSSKSFYAAGIDAADVATGDLNNDSLQDIVVVNRGDISGSVTVYMQDPLEVGTFHAGMSYPTGENSQAIAIDDLNGDLLPDLVVADNGSGGGSVSILLQNALTQGVFLPADTYPGMSGPNDVATSDVNGDGLTDLVIADKCTRTRNKPYFRYQDINNPGKFLYPIHFP